MNLNKFIINFRKNLNKIDSHEELKQFKSKILKSKILLDLKNNLKSKNISAEERKKIGLELTKVNSEIFKSIEEKSRKILSKNFLKKYENDVFNCDHNLNFKKNVGSLHPLTLLTNKIIDFFENMGFNFSYGIEVEKEKYNFENLNIPKDHRARTMHDTFYLKDKNMILRTHATNMTARHLEIESKNKNDDPKFFVSIGPVYRNDDSDKTHSFQFSQIDIFGISKDLSISNLKYLINEFLKYLFKDKIEIRYRLSHFPFTEPSFEVDIKWKNKWLEVLGCGMINAEVMKKNGIDEEKNFILAAGIGLERIAMLLWGIDDIRSFYLNEEKFLTSRFEI